LQFFLGKKACCPAETRIRSQQILPLPGSEVWLKVVAEEVDFAFVLKGRGFKPRRK